MCRRIKNERAPFEYSSMGGIMKTTTTISLLVMILAFTHEAVARSSSSRFLSPSHRTSLRSEWSFQGGMGWWRSLPSLSSSQ